MSSEYKKCYFESKREGVLHRLPNPFYNLERFNKWNSVLDSNMQNRNPEYIYNNNCVTRLCITILCDIHFIMCYHTPSTKLTRNAIPTINIGSPKKAVAILQHEIIDNSQLIPMKNIPTSVEIPISSIYMLDCHILKL